MPLCMYGSIICLHVHMLASTHTQNANLQCIYIFFIHFIQSFNLQHHIEMFSELLHSLHMNAYLIFHWFSVPACTESLLCYIVIFSFEFLSPGTKYLLAEKVLLCERKCCLFRAVSKIGQNVQTSRKHLYFATSIDFSGPT